MLFFFFSRSGDHRDLHSFPTRRSSDLVEALAAALKFAHFELVSANYDVKGTVLEGRIKPYVVKTLGGIKVGLFGLGVSPVRSEEHTSELQSLAYLVCRLLLEKKKKKK